MVYKVSVIMPTFNSERYIEESIASVLSQSYNSFELIIIDNRSTDSTIELIKKMSKYDSRIKLYVNDINMGIAYSRNRGISISTGEFLTFLDSDDFWDIKKIETQLEFMLLNKLDFTYTKYSLMDDTGLMVGKVRTGPYIVDYKNLLKSNYIGILTVMIKSEIIKKYKMPEIKYEDYATWLNILKSGYNVVLLDEELAIYRIHNSYSSNKFVTLFWTYNVYKKSQGFGMITSFILLLRFIFNTIIKKIK